MISHAPFLQAGAAEPRAVWLQAVQQLKAVRSLQDVHVGPAWLPPVSVHDETAVARYAGVRSWVSMCAQADAASALLDACPSALKELSMTWNMLRCNKEVNPLSLHIDIFEKSRGKGGRLVLCLTRTDNKDCAMLVCTNLGGRYGPFRCVAALEESDPTFAEWLRDAEKEHPGMANRICKLVHALRDAGLLSTDDIDSADSCPVADYCDVVCACQLEQLRPQLLQLEPQISPRLLDSVFAMATSGVYTPPCTLPELVAARKAVA